MGALDQIASWEVPIASGAVVAADGAVLATHGDIDRPFRLASITKVVVGWTAMIAIEEGVIAPHDLDLYTDLAVSPPTPPPAASAVAEPGTLAGGTKYVLSHLWSGAGVDIEVVATDTE